MMNRRLLMRSFVDRRRALALVSHCCFCLLYCLSSAIASADAIYFWVDAQGKKHFSDKQPKNEAVKIKPSHKTPTVDDHALQRQRAMQNYLQEKTKQRQQQEIQQEQARSREKATANRCQKVQRELARDKMVSVMYGLDEDGQRRIWSHEKCLHYQKQLLKAQKRHCYSQ